MKGEIIYKILDLLENKVMDSFDLASSIVNAGYGANFNKIDREVEKRSAKRLTNRIEKEKIRHIRKYLYKLKNDGLISKDSSGKVILTSKGNQKLDVFKKSFLLNKNDYQKEKSDKVIIISYDLPTAFNRERNILRDILRMLGFEVIHKSVWVGKVKLPKKFIVKVGQMGILDFIEILEVTKNGTLKELT